MTHAYHGDFLCARRQEAAREAAGEPILSSFLYTSILAHDSFERSLAFVLSNRLSNATMIATQLFEIFLDVLADDDAVRMGAFADVEAYRERVRRHTPLAHSPRQYYSPVVGQQYARLQHARP
jgi:serine O-acetyltransferase